MAMQQIGTKESQVRSYRSRSGFVPFYLPYMFLIPAFILLVVFRYVPAGSAVYHSFTDWDGTSSATYVGLKHYKELWHDEVFLLALQNIVIYTVSRTVISTVMAFIGAELVYNLRSRIMQGIWQFLFTAPVVIPLTVIFLIWQRVYAGRLGLLNNFLQSVGMPEYVKPWLGQPDTALQALTLVGFPMVAGISFLILLAALQGLPQDINEAALLDGCSRLRRIFAIDIPSIRGPLALVIFLSINAGLQEFAPMLIMTSGGPINRTQTPGLYLYQQAFTYGKFGYGTAIGSVLMVITLTFSLVILWSRYRSAHDVDI